MNGSESANGIGRRTFLAGAAGATVAAGAAGTASANEDLEAWLEDVPNYESVADHTGEDEVRVAVGAVDGFRFDPPAIQVDPGTTVVWEWTGEGGSHNVADEAEAFESELTDEEGFEFEHTFDEEGLSLYGCTPHIPAGMKGAVAVGEEALESGGGGGGVPLVPGVLASLGIISVVTVAISKWAGAGRDATRT